MVSLRPAGAKNRLSPDYAFVPKCAIFLTNNDHRPRQHKNAKQALPNHGPTACFQDSGTNKKSSLPKISIPHSFLSGNEKCATADRSLDLVPFKDELYYDTHEQQMDGE
jgi:hypothetical protein